MIGPANKGQPFDEREDAIRWSQAMHLSDSILDDAKKIPENLLSEAYREITLSTVMASALRHGLTLVANDLGGLDITANHDVPDEVLNTVERRGSDIVAMLAATEPELSKSPSWVMARAVLIASRYVSDQARYHLLTTMETQVMVTAISIAFGQALRVMVEHDHPGDVQGTA